jgi:Lipid A 3-O-deacylase (PagL)
VLHRLTIVSALVASTALAQESIPPPAPASVDLSAAASTQASTQSGNAAEHRAGVRTQSNYTNEGSTWWTFGAGASTDFDELSDMNVTAAIEHFVVDDISIIGELALRDFDIPGDDVQAINPAVVFRYHFLGDDHNDWTVFADIGIGVQFSTDDVPQDGTSINFTPRAGVGFTKAISHNWRIQVGARWSHISNGRIFGDDDNPSSDGIMAFVGFTMPF